MGLPAFLPRDSPSLPAEEPQLRSRESFGSAGKSKAGFLEGTVKSLCEVNLKILGRVLETTIINPEKFMTSFEHMKNSGDY